MTSKNSLKIGKVSVNINGDFEDEILIEKLRQIEKLVEIVWIGESDFFKDPFYLAELFLENSKIKVGFGVLRAFNCERILRNLKKLSDYDDRIIVGIAGDRIELTYSCVKKLREKFDFPVLCGATGKRSIRKLSEIADGMLLNHISPKHVSWAVKHSTSDFNAAYGPALVLPSEFEQDLLIAAALVMGSSEAFLKEMGYEAIYEEISKVDLMRLIELRHKGDIYGEEDYRKLLKHKQFLLENFTLCGSVHEISQKMLRILELCDHVILADPFFRDENFDRNLKKIKELVL